MPGRMSLIVNTSFHLPLACSKTQLPLLKDPSWREKSLVWLCQDCPLDSSSDQTWESKHFMPATFLISTVAFSHTWQSWEKWNLHMWDGCGLSHSYDSKWRYVWAKEIIMNSEEKSMSLITANHGTTAHITMCKRATPQSPCQESSSGRCRCLLAFFSGPALVITHLTACFKAFTVYKNVHLECKQVSNIQRSCGWQ